MIAQRMKVPGFLPYEESYSRRFTISLVMARWGGFRIRAMQLVLRMDLS
jgi:hypothetical protein